ncbi:hypothetical protein OS493_034808, partial [Desmophyllum pertusum]
ARKHKVEDLVLGASHQNTSYCTNSKPVTSALADMFVWALRPCCHSQMDQL